LEIPKKGKLLKHYIETKRQNNQKGNQPLF